MDAAGGEAAVVTTFGLGVTEAEWSPLGTRLAVIATEWIEPDLTEDERKRRPRRLRDAGYRFDNLGWLHDRRRNVYLVDPPVAIGGSPPATATPGHWRPDGARWRSSAPATSGDTSSREPAWEVGSGGPRRWWTGRGAGVYPRGVAHLVGDPDLGYPGSRVWRIEPSGRYGSRGLDHFTVPRGVPSGPQWLADGRFRSALEIAVRFASSRSGGRRLATSPVARVITG
jgi:dipeptidyl aminopeptidase/acylaminoacyl peptidase